MRKGTKNKIIHGILIIFVIIIALLASLVAAFRDVTLQTMVARSLAGEMSKRLNSEVKIRTFYITYDLGVVLEDVQINDLYNFPIFKIGKLYAKVAPTVDYADIRVRDIYFEDVLGSIVKYEGTEKLNIIDLFGQLSSGQPKDGPKEASGGDFHLKIDNMRLDNGRVVYWNQNKHHPEKLSMDWHHIDIDSIYGTFTDLEIKHDTVMWKVHTLRGKDRCGLVLDDGHGEVLFCEKALNIDNLMLVTGESKADLDMRFEYESSSAYYEFEDSVRIIGNIRKSTIKISDLKYFSWVLGKLPDTFVFTAFFDGPVSDFLVKDVDADFGDNSHIVTDVAFKGLPEFETSFMDITIRELTTTRDDIDNFAIPIEAVTVPMPAMLDGLGNVFMSGEFKGYYDDFYTNFKIQSDMGDVEAYVYLNTTENSEYVFNIQADDLNIKDIAGLKDESVVTFDLSMDGRGLDVQSTDFNADVEVESLKINGNDFKDFNIHTEFENKCLTADMSTRQPLIGLDLTAVVDLEKEKPRYKISAKIEDADLVNLNLADYDSVMMLSSDVNLDFRGSNIDDITGTADIKNTKYFNGDTYTMQNFTASVTEISGIKDVTVNCDFFDFNGTGIISSGTFVEAFKNSARQYIHIPAWYDKELRYADKQEFSISLNTKDTRQLSKLFMPELYVSSGTTVNATYTTEYPYHGMTLESPEVAYNNLKFLNIDVRNTARHDEYLSSLTIEDIIMRDTSEKYTQRIGLKNVQVYSTIHNDTVKVHLLWDDDVNEDHNKAHLTSTFVPHKDAGGLMKIAAEQLVLNDTLWHLHPNCQIDFRKNRIGINCLALNTESQSLALNGYVPQHNNDTMMVVFNDVNVSDFDFITVGDGIDMDGIINGIVRVSGLDENLSFFSNLELQKFYLNEQEVGDVYVSTEWHDPDKSIRIKSELYNSLFGEEKHEAVGLAGYYYPLRDHDNLKFNLNFDEFKLATLSPFISNVVKRMSGHASGNVKIRGSFKQPVILGQVAMHNAGCLVNYLNTYFTFNDTITLARDKIVFNDINIRDTTGHTAKLNGIIHHKHLDDFYFDLNIKCNDFLALNIPAENAEGFYGTAVADGTVSLNGPLDDIVMNIDVLSKRGTEIDVPLSSASTMNDDFIVFVKSAEEEDTVVEKYVPVTNKDDSRYTININTQVTPDAEVNIFLPANMGSINARGLGNLSMGVTDNDFTLRGDYLIRSGTFNFAYDVVRRTFTLRDGGTIRWAGDPTDADINITGVYRTKSSLNSLGATAVDTTALTDNINVDCIIKLTDKLMNPTITFGIELPNVKEDTRSLVYSIIDTTNQGVMAQQVFSLLMLGSFSYAAESNMARIGTTAGYGVITRQLSSWLSQISKDFDVGINYTPNDRLTNEELEVALSTQLFDDRLIIEGNFGVIRGDKGTTNKANNIVGDVDISFKLTKRLSVKAYNHTNIKNNYYIYSFENYSDFTQGLGISYSQSFDNVREIFNIHKKNKNR